MLSMKATLRAVMSADVGQAGVCSTEGLTSWKEQSSV
jgi:hypothetical protein